MARTLNINHLVQQPEEARDPEWEQALFAALPESQLILDQKESQAGPDGWPYLFARTSAKATEPAARVLEWLSERGIGLVLNADKEYPDYVFTYGMIWNYRERGEFLTKSETTIVPGEIVIGKGHEVLVGTPSESFLPKYVRKVIKEFFAEQSVLNPRILMLSAEKDHFDLCFSRESIGNPPDNEAQGVGEAISWFLPAHYSVAIISEKEFQGFEAL